MLLDSVPVNTKSKKHTTSLKPWNETCAETAEIRGKAFHPLNLGKDRIGLSSYDHRDETRPNVPLSQKDVDLILSRL